MRHGDAKVTPPKSQSKLFGERKAFAAPRARALVNDRVVAVVTMRFLRVRRLPIRSP
jgi:hypothetical protein